MSGLLQSFLCCAAVMLATGCSSTRAPVSEAPARTESEAVHLSTSSEVPALESLHYAAKVDSDFERLEVQMCWKGQNPISLRPASSGADHLLWLRVGEREIERADGHVEREALSADGCLDYALDLESLGQGSRMGYFDEGEAPTTLFKTSTWLWRPHKVPKGLKLSASFELPESVDVATSWDVDAQGVHHFDSTVFGMRSYTMFGQIERDRFEVGGTTFDVVAPPRARKLTRQGARHFLTASGEAVAELYGRFPVDQLEVILTPVDAWGSDPVAFGMANRGGGASIILLIDAGASDESFLGEWVSIHEMLHLAMPFVDGRDAWFSEGYATYYQQVLRARAGLFHPKPRAGESTEDGQARVALGLFLTGFKRALAYGEGSLAQWSATMHQRGGYGRVYWGGAGAWLRADVELRIATDGAHDLDELMREIWSQFGDRPGIWRAEQLLKPMRRTTRSWGPEAEAAFEAALEELVEAPKHPELDRCFADLALDLGTEGLQLMREPASEAAIRAAIFSP